MIVEDSYFAIDRATTVNCSPGETVDFEMEHNNNTFNITTQLTASVIGSDINSPPSLLLTYNTFAKTNNSESNAETTDPTLSDDMIKSQDVTSQDFNTGLLSSTTGTGQTSASLYMERDNISTKCKYEKNDYIKKIFWMNQVYNVSILLSCT